MPIELTISRSLKSTYPGTSRQWRKGLAVANGGLYVSTDTGNIHAFGNFEPADINNDGFVNALDLAEMSSQWEDCTNPNDVDCRDVTQ